MTSATVALVLLVLAGLLVVWNIVTNRSASILDLAVLCVVLAFLVTRWPLR